MSISISGNGSFTGANVDYSFDQSVGIAGTLTYEDVTSVDSVGIITARSGINVGPTSGIGITLHADGKVTSSLIQVSRPTGDKACFIAEENGVTKTQIFANGNITAAGDVFSGASRVNPGDGVGSYLAATNGVLATTSGGTPVFRGYVNGTGTPTSQIFNTGGATFESDVVVNSNGGGTPKTKLWSDGSASLATGSISLNSNGSASFKAPTANGVEVQTVGGNEGTKFPFVGKNTSGTTTFSVNGDGSITTTSTLDVSADITCNQNLLIRGGDSNGVYVRNAADTAWNAQIQGSGLATFKNKLTVQVDSASAVDTVDIFNGTSGGDNRVKIRTFANGGGDPYVFFDGGGNNMVVGLSYAGTTNNELVMGTGNNASDVNGLRINGLGNITIKPSNVSSVSGTNTNYLGFRITQTNNQSALLATIKAQGQSAWGGDLIISTKNNNATPDDNVTERLRLGSGGKLTVPGAYSSTTTGGGPLYVEADGDFLRYTSSLKYKTDVETIDNTRADAILNCRPVWYRSKCSNDIKTEGAEKSDWGWYGFIAEEVAEIEPRLVNWATKDAVLQEDGTNKSVERDPADYEAEGVRYENFVPLLVNLVKRQQAAIETLEAKVQALEGS